jgi:OFA family oxalate/formate antiporter-like MFS transporter
MYYRWICLSASVLVMMIISIYQYSWFLFAYSIETELHWSLAVLGLAFTVFNLATFAQPISGFLADAYGPRKVALAGALLVGIGFLFTSTVSSPWQLYLYYGLGGVGVGALYGVSTAGAIKWFPDRRGFATGLVVFGFGAGTAFFNWLIQSLLEAHGFRSTFVYLGIGMLGVLVPLSLFLRHPAESLATSLKTERDKITATSVNYKPPEMLGTHQWYLIYFSFLFTISIVLMFGAQMKMLAKEFAMPDSYFGAVMVLFPMGNGLSRVLAGGVSDRLGRERTMVLFYSLLGLTIFGLVAVGHIHILFVVLVFLAALLGGAPFALYPATIGDYYGARYSTANYGITYTAKVWAGLISGWLSGYLVAQFGSYKIPLLSVAACSLVAACVSNPKLLKPPMSRDNG